VNPDLDLLSAAVITGAGFVAGFINSIVGSGTLFSFPTIVGLGYSEPAANMANGTGLFPGSMSAVAAQRTELADQRHRIRRLAPASALGAAIGAVLLLTLPETYFGAVVPFLILFGVVLVVVGPAVQRRVRQRAEQSGIVHGAERIAPAASVAVFLSGIYGGYFGAAQGIILMGILGVALHDTMARLNAVKNVLAGTANGVSAVVFAIRGSVIWPVAGLVAVGSIAGGLVGSRVGRRIPPNVLRALIVVVGLVAAGRLLLD
jgi:uncharacterized protein